LPEYAILRPNRSTSALLAIACLLLASPSAASPPGCTCREGNACYHSLGAPVDSPDDPCSCLRCRAERGTCGTVRPAGWDTDCAAGALVECFLRRHAVSWRISCSERLKGTCKCARAHPEWCPRCGDDGGDWDREGLDLIKRQVEVEERLFGKGGKLVVARSPHFYLVTDIPRIRIILQRGGVRWMGTHEIAHVFLQRAEEAWKDFTAVFGDRMTYERPCAIYLLEKEKTKRTVASAYLGNFEPELLYGADAKTIGGGYGYNGLAISTEKHNDDYRLHFQMRHLLGHLLISCWVEGGGAVEILPKWMYAGAGHWLSRLPEKFEDRVSFCSGEGVAVSGSGRQWIRKLRKLAAKRDTDPIQRLLDEKSFDGLDLRMHMRSWSWFHFFLREDRERFLAFMAAIRGRTDQRKAMSDAFKCLPEEFDRRLRGRLLGHRGSVAATVEELDAADPTAPGVGERRAIRTEQDPEVLASRIRALPPVADRRTAETVLPLLASKSDDVREAVVVLLGKSRDERVKKWLRGEGIEDHGPAVRAHLVRALGRHRDEADAELIVDLAGDPVWLVRAHVAQALGLLGRSGDIPLLRKLVADSSPKVRIAALDALAAFGRKASDAWPDAARLLSASAWQVRSAAVECLAALGDTGAVDALIDRMEVENGRLRHDVRAALKAITRDDLGNDPRHWREWWEGEKGRGAPAPKPAGDAGDHGYAKDTPTYYGIPVFTESVGYVLDTSTSMNFRIELDPEWLARCGRNYPAVATKYELAQCEIAASLDALDPRTLMNLYFFKTRARAWKKTLVPATRANVGKAADAVRLERPPEKLTVGGGAYQTNYVDVFRLILGTREGEIPAGFPKTPDTVFFLTDGKPTAGDITDADTLLSWFRELNRFARLKVNVITFGKLESNPVFLRRLAVENGGKFIEVPRRE